MMGRNHRVDDKSLMARRLALLSGLVLLKLPHECGSMVKLMHEKEVR